ncbi:hypothetical protein MKW94_015348 [Papaver nudicaule]|uniref:Uncharacterized protein n=1 Tax=Papaver nudicaule TaxID=74823 RepID=A0AA41S1J8_PAPNU|nr:hypothetical protein [Papaver nudicaule]
MGDTEPEKPKVYRGDAKLEWLSKLQPGEKVSYEHINGVPTGDNASKLSAFAGKLAKDGHYFPFDVRSWPDIHDLSAVIERVKDEMKNVFHWHEESHYWLYQTLNDTWRKNKHRKKEKYFKPKHSLEEQYANCPPRMVHAQWENMVDYWHTGEFKVCESLNTCFSVKYV